MPFYEVDDGRRGQLPKLVYERENFDSQAYRSSSHSEDVGLLILERCDSFDQGLSKLVTHRDGRGRIMWAQRAD